MADTSDTAGTPDTPKTDDDPPVENPTWFGNVRYYFTEDDINHMAAKGYDLGTYDGVVGDAVTIRGVTKAGTMPKGDLPKWSKNRVQNFLNWMDQKFPLGNPPDPATAAARRGSRRPNGRIGCTGGADTQRGDHAQRRRGHVAQKGVLGRHGPRSVACPTAISRLPAFTGIRPETRTGLSTAFIRRTVSFPGIAPISSASRTHFARWRAAPA